MTIDKMGGKPPHPLYDEGKAKQGALGQGGRVVWRGKGEEGTLATIVGSFVDLGFVLLGNWERRVCLLFPRKGTLNPKPY